ncbi:hypothetical protein MmiEs2_07630 [Methanimicrococcus stummii]|uniref:SD-repeat containing protein B domain-containing protein n=1 Tax=Methanimicrococcus stummii TaxID=3028294 RepID=A0AA96V875_9EURY|nr:SdrD B-like domain-containing protein [Methanimicrococcus sp. Es2]WNY28569.1 hypothetical protein MmiEs2_07630 [Methanimicrococcus sp. Es2]
MKSRMESSVVLLISILVLLLLIAPAAAADDDYQISYKWSSGKSSETQVESFQPTNTSTLTYTVIAKESISSIYFIAEVEEDGTETKPGFKISGYPKTDLVSGTTTIAKISNTNYNRSNGTLIIPLTNAAQRFSIDLTIESDAATVYHDETNTIKAGLYVKEGDTYVPVSNSVTATANNKYPQLSSRGTFQLLNPSLMPSGESEVDLQYVFYTTSGINSNWNTLSTKGLRVNFTSFTLDFSDVDIKADGVNKTYSQWIADGNSPVEFSTAATTGYTSKLSDDKMKITFTPTIATRYFSWNQTFNFSFNTTDDFKFNGAVAPYINFTNLSDSAEMKINSRGDPVQFTNIEKAANNNAAYLLPHYTEGTLTGAASDKVTATLYSSSGANRIISNSVSYDPSSPFYYQELFKATFRNTIRDGSDESFTFDIPAGVAVTHLRVPKSGSDVAQYDSITILKDGKNYTIDNASSRVVELTTLTADEDDSPMASYSPGEYVAFKINGLVLIERSTGGAQSYSAAHTLTVIGTTDIATPGQYEFKILTLGPTTLSTLKPTFATDYVVSPYLANTVRYLSDSSTGYTANPSLVSRGETFYMYNTFYASGYPYGSAIRVSPTNTAGIYSNPVIYFSVPKDLDPGTVQITTSNGVDVIANGAFTDIDGNALAITQNVYDNAGLYPGGKLVEAKIHLAESGKEGDTFWINSTQRYARLPVTVSQEFLGTSFDFKTNSVLISSWDSAALSSQTGGSGGTNYNIAADSGFSQAIARSNTHGSYPSYLIGAKVFVQDDASVVSSTGVRIGSDYIYYNPASTDSYPSLKAGSSNEMFKIYFYNGIGETIGDNNDPATIYFILPAHATWRPTLKDVTSLDITEAGDIDQYMIYYTYDTDIDSSDIGDYSLTDAAGFDWVAIADVNNVGGIDWDRVTAIKCEFYEAEDKSRFELLLPFELPAVDGTTVVFDQTAIGQTLFDVRIAGSTVMSSPSSYTAAVLLSPSDAPEIYSGGGTAFLPNYEVAYQTGTLPGWNNIITYDDFTANIGLTSVNVTFKDITGTETINDSLSIGTFFNRTAYPAAVDHAAGYEYTLNTTSGITNPVSTSEVGNYTIEYKTAPDGEGNISTVTTHIEIKKAASTVTLTNPASSQEIYMNADVPNGYADWETYFRQFVSGTDMNVPISNDKFVYDSANSTFNSAVPGNQVAKYTYTDVALNTQTATVNVIVKYTDELIVNAVASGTPESPVMDLSVTILSTGVPSSSSSPVYNIDKNGYNASVYAKPATPTTIDYDISYSNVPAGLIDANSGSVLGSIVYSVDTSVYKLVFTPAKVIVNLDNASFVESISMYQKDVSGDLCIETIPILGTESTVSFETETGWFDDEDYYLVAELYPGYTLTSSDFSAAGSLIYLKTADFNFANADAEFDLFVSESELITGRVWNDANRNSLIDEDTFVSGAIVRLLDSTGTTVLDTAMTADDGSYYFIGMGADTDFIVQVTVPSGYTHASAFINDQKINGSNNYSSEIVRPESLGQIHITDIDAGFYRQSGGSGGNGGQATVNNGTSSTGSEAEDGGGAGGDLTEESPGSAFTDPVTTPDLPEEKKFPLWIVGLLLVLAILVFAGWQIWNKKKN